MTLEELKVIITAETSGLKKELKPHIMLSAESVLRWLQEEV